MLTEAHVKPVLAIFMLALVGGCATVSSVPSPGIVDGKPSLTTARRTVTFGAFNFLAPPYRDGHRLFAVNRQPNWMSRAMAAARTQGYLFVADEAKNVVDIFPKHHGRSPIGMISNGVASPDGLAVDGASNVYVTNLANATVTVYAPPYTGGPTATYSQALTDPVAVAVGRNGTVYVSNFYSGQVVEYAHHGAKPSRILSIAGAYTEGVALDAQNNLYVGFNGPSGPGDVMKYAPHSSTGTDLGTIVSFCGGLAIDKNDNLLLADQFGNPPAVDVFPPGTTTPSQTIANGFYDPYGVALSGSDLYVVDSSPQQTVQQISYPSGVTVNTIGGFTQALGVAVTKGS
ncbi:MAG: hypothetical protein JO043_06595 [Candidatus Eremiobacteraeota bacterium]|nr:hypothetical protein [Candidatus Eremiobacteraeota bacterium]